MKPRPKLGSFDLPPGRRIAGKYEVVEFLGGGWEGEVYKVVESRTGVPRAAKVFYPHRNERDRAVTFYARKLERLRHCPIVIQYHHTENFWHHGHRVTCLISEYVEGELLSAHVASRPGKRLPTFEALHVLHALARGLEEIHALRDYHGDLHDENVLVRRQGVHYHVRLLDFFSWGRPDREKIQEDVFQLVRLLYDAVGGRKHYARQDAAVKAICCGLRRDLIRKKFASAAQLRAHLDTFAWD